MKRYRSRRIFFILILLFLSIVLISCSSSTSTGNANNSGENSAPKSASGQGKTGEGGVGATFEEILKKSKEEGKLVWLGDNPREPVLKELEKAFNKRFGLNISIEGVAVHPNDTPARLIAENKAGKMTADAVALNQANLKPIVDAGILKKTNWTDLFKKELPEVSIVENDLIEEYKGLGLEWRSLVYGVSYNTNLVKKEELPKQWNDLLDPKWKGRIAIDSTLTPFRRLVQPLGFDPAVKFAQEFLKNKPIFAKGSSGSITKVVSGEAALGIGALSSVLEQIEHGAPVLPVYMNPMPTVDVEVVFVPLNAPHPNLARLWTAWLTTEGFQITSKYGVAQARPGAPGPFGEAIDKNKLEISRAKTMKDLDDDTKIKNKLQELTQAK